EGATVRVGTLLAVLDDDGDGDGAPGRQGEGAPGRRGDRARAHEDNGSFEDSPIRPLSHSPAPAKGGPPISPVVARLSAEHGIDLGKISGTGQGGRVTKQDVLKYIESRKSEPALQPSVSATASEPPSPATREPAFQASAAPPPQAGAVAFVPTMPAPG